MATRRPKPFRTPPQPTQAPSPRKPPSRSSPRLTGLPTYVFAWLDQLKAAARMRGASLIDLGIGNPDRSTPRVVTDAIAAAYADPKTHGYPPFRGTPRFLRAAADFMRSRFGVELDPEREVLCISGGKEGIAQLTIDRKSTRLNSSHANISYAVFCLKKQNNNLKKKLCHDIID